MEKQITAPISKETARTLKAGDYVYITGTIYTARDAAHKRMKETLEKGMELPLDLKGQMIYYMGPSPAREGRPIGSAGPTTASRMDKYAPELLDLGLGGMIGKGKRSKAVIDAIVRNDAVYLAAVGGAGALLSKCIKSSEVIAYDDLGTEAIRRLEVENFPVIVVVDSEGNNLYETAIQAYRTEDTTQKKKKWYHKYKTYKGAKYETNYNDGLEKSPLCPIRMVQTVLLCEPCRKIYRRAALQPSEIYRRESQQRGQCPYRRIWTREHTRAEWIYVFSKSPGTLRCTGDHRSLSDSVFSRGQKRNCQYSVFKTGVRMYESIYDRQGRCTAGYGNHCECDKRSKKRQKLSDLCRRNKIETGKSARRIQRRKLQSSYQSEMSDRPSCTH